MARLRGASSYRRLKRPYTRHSKVKSKAYVKGAPAIKVVHYDMGNLQKKFQCRVEMLSKKAINLRENALEAGRQAANKYMNQAHKGNFAIKIYAIPHQIMRLKPIATGAGADRYSQGMSHAFGKPIGHSCRVYAGKLLMSIFVDNDAVSDAREAARKAISKYPMGCTVRQVSLAQ